jgi:hypothetical protein
MTYNIDSGSLPQNSMFYLFRLFYSFLPLHNPIGFGVADFIELALALLLAAAAFGWQKWSGQVNRLALKTIWCMAILGALPVLLRLSMLHTSPIPTPLGADDFSYLLLGDTLSHFRLTNPTHPMHRFFETLFILQEPSYSSIYPLGPGLALAFGKLVFRQPWAGIAISTAAFTALSYWMLRAWTKPAWALLGGFLAVIEFGPFSHWMNTFWGGALAAAAGCLVFGSMPRLKQRWRIRDAVLLGIGLAIHVLTRPFESIFLAIAIVWFFVPVKELQPLLRTASIAGLIVVAAFALMLFHDKRVTGSWTTLPYAQCRFEYGVPCTFTLQANPVPHRPLTPEQQTAFEVQSFVHGPGTDTFQSFLDRLAGRVRFYRFFFLPPLYLALPFFFWSFRDPRMRYVFFILLLFFVGTNIYPYFYAHYVAGVTCLFLLVTVVSLENLSRLTMANHLVGPDAVRVIVFLCAAHFVFWYGVQLSDHPELEQYETWDEVNHGDPVGRIGVNRQLAQVPGKQLVFVRYWPKHEVTEWVYNGADIDGQTVVFARDLGAPENEKLRAYYPDRKAWLLEPDARPPKLSPYQQTETPEPVAPPSQPAPAPPKKHPMLKFEKVK